MFEHAGRTENEPLTEFELNKLELVAVDNDKADDDANQQQREEEGDEVLGVEFLFLLLPFTHSRVFTDPRFLLLAFCLSANSLARSDDERGMKNPKETSNDFKEFGNRNMLLVLFLVAKSYLLSLSPDSSRCQFSCRGGTRD